MKRTGKANQMRARVMNYAWSIFKATGATWRECMLKAWALMRLLNKMAEGIVEFTYLKVGGGLRKAIGTLRDINYKRKGSGTPRYSTVCYYDTGKMAFRSFRVENLIEVKSV